MTLTAVASPAARRNPLAIAAARLDPTSERGAIERERAAAMGDVATFAGHASILDPLAGLRHFGEIAWPWQLQLLSLWAITRLTVILKARQLGVSWLAAIYVVWFALRRPRQVILLISIRQEDADKLLGKVAFVWEHLPGWRGTARIAARSIAFANGSEVESMPATANIGRSRTASLVILDEHAYQAFARKIFLALKPVAEKGQIIAISSGNGQGSLHAEIYRAAKAGTNGWRALFVPATAHPERRSTSWREINRAEMSALSDALYAQEYPENDIEALVATGRPVFGHEDLGRQPIEAGRPGPPGVTIYRDPEPGRIYLVGADVGEGLATSDWSSAQVIERESGEQVASVRGRWTPDVFAARIAELAGRYAVFPSATHPIPVIVGVERNNHGHAVLLALRGLAAGARGWRLYRAPDRRLGWLTTSATRPVLVDQLEEAVRTGAVVLHDAGTVDQMATFAYSDDGRPEAAEGYHDDDVLALGIAWQLRRRAFGRVLGMEGRAA